MPGADIELPHWPTLRVVWPLVGAAVCLVAFHAFGRFALGGFLLDLGSITIPNVRYATFLLYWTSLGSTAALLLFVGLFRTYGSIPPASRSFRSGVPLSDTQWIVVGSLAAFALPAALRAFLLHGAPITDDESCYRFAAELLASGRLRAESPPMKLFFDNVFMINDGHLYPKYFLGWPALMVPGVWLGATGYMNSLWSALTVPPLFLVLRRLAGSSWARLGLIIYLLAPMLMVGAATELSHTSCLMALFWLAWCALRAEDQDAPPWLGAAAALCFSTAFFIRPGAALGIGAPLVGWWAWQQWQRRGSSRTRAFAGFLVVGVTCAALFLIANRIQNGSFLTTAYARALEYARENHFRFSGWIDEAALGTEGFVFGRPLEALMLTTTGLLRLNYALFGWPCSFVFLPFAGTRRRAWLFWACAGGFTVLHFYQADPGIDTFGPLHHYELALPILVLTVLGVKTLAERCAQWAGDLGALTLGVLAVCSLLAVALPGYDLVRLQTLGRIAENIRQPQAAVAAAALHRAVIFAPRPFIDQRSIAPTRHFVFWRPNNDPDLRRDVLWVNHINVQEDRALMAQFPDRRGYVMIWDPARVRFLPLETLQPGSVPDGLMTPYGVAPAGRPRG